MVSIARTAYDWGWWLIGIEVGDLVLFYVLVKLPLLKPGRRTQVLLLSCFGVGAVSFLVVFLLLIVALGYMEWRHDNGLPA